MSRTITWALALCLLLAPGCGAFRGEMQRSALARAAEDLGTRCGPLKVTALNGWSFRAESACGKVLYYRCGTHGHHRVRPVGRLPHFDCHAHASEEEVVGLLHPQDAPHGRRAGSGP